MSREKTTETGFGGEGRGPDTCIEGKRQKDSGKERRGARKREWFDDDGFWEGLYPFLFNEGRFAEAPAQVEKALALTQPPGTRVLDLCCGPGRCAVPLAKQGYEVTGVDRTRFLLDKARQRAAEAQVEVEWVEADMRDFLRKGAFDLALSFFTSFGYFDDKREDVQVLRNLHESLSPGGVLLIDVVGKEHLAREFQPVAIDVLEDGSKLVLIHEIWDEWTRMRNEWILIRDGAARSYRFHHTLYSGQELRDRLETVGFREVKLYGNLDGDEYGPDTHRLVAVGRR